MIAKNDSVQSMLAFIIERMATKDDLAEAVAGLRAEMVSKDDLADAMATLRGEMATKDDLERMATKEDLEYMATKADLRDLREEMLFELEKTEERLMAEIRPLGRALERHAEKLADHERRITAQERA